MYILIVRDTYFDVAYIDSWPHITDIVAIANKPSIEVFDGSLCSLVKVLIVIKTLAVFVDGVVGQVHVLLLLQETKVHVMSLLDVHVQWLQVATAINT